MIATFKVQNFRSFKHKQELSFIPSRERLGDKYCCIEPKEGVRLLKTALIYGANASGKTNLLLALETLGNLITIAPQDKTKPVKVKPFLLDDVSNEEPTLFEIEFYLEKERYRYELATNRDHIFTEELYFYPRGRASRLYFRSYNFSTDSTEIEFGPKLELDEVSKSIILGNTLNNCTVLASFGKSNVATSRLNTVYDFFAHSLQRVLDPRHDLVPYTIDTLKQHPEMKEFLLDELQKSDFNICNIEIETTEKLMPEGFRRAIEIDNTIPTEAKKEILNRPSYIDQKLLYAHCTDTGIHFLPQEAESQGTRRYTGLAALMYNIKCQDTVLMIDEAETSLHYELMSHFIEDFLANSDRESQLVITTHNTNLFDEPFIRRDTVWIAEKNGNGETKLSRLNDKKLHARVSVRNAYIGGSLGGKPNIGKIINRREE